MKIFITDEIQMNGVFTDKYDPFSPIEKKPYVLIIGKEDCTNCADVISSFKFMGFSEYIDVIFVHLTDDDFINPDSYFNKKLMKKYPETKEMSMPIILYCNEDNKVEKTEEMDIVSRTIENINSFAESVKPDDEKGDLFIGADSKKIYILTKYFKLLYYSF